MWAYFISILHFLIALTAAYKTFSSFFSVKIVKVNSKYNIWVSVSVQMKVLHFGFTITWNGKSTKAHSENEEGNGDSSSVRESNHQQQSGLHTKPWRVKDDEGEMSQRKIYL